MTEESDRKQNIILSHPFQDRLAEDFGDILREVKARLLREKAENAIHGTKEVSWGADSVLQDEGDDYNSVNNTTLYYVREAFYEKHKDNIEELIGMYNLNFIEKLGADYGSVMYTRLDELYYRNDGVAVFAREGTDGIDGSISFIDELTKGKKLEEGDKLVVVRKKIQDENGEEIEEFRAYRYENGRYTSCYEHYNPLTSERNSKECIINTTNRVLESKRNEEKGGLSPKLIKTATNSLHHLK